MAHPRKCDAGISAAPTRDAPTGITVQDYRPFSLHSRELLLKKATISLLYYIIKALINSLMESCCGRTKEEFMMKICQL